MSVNVFMRKNIMNETANTSRRPKHTTKYLRKKRRQRKFKKLLRTTVILLFCGAILSFGVSAYKNATAPAASSLLNREVVDMLKDLQKTDARAKTILNHPEDYPEEVLNVLLKNPETLDFVLNYPKKHDSAPSDSIGKVKDGTVPHLLQWDERWGYATYGDGLLAATGCGPTCLSMVIAGLTGDSSVTPLVIADYSIENGYYVAGTGSSWDLMGAAAAAYGLNCNELPLSKSKIFQTLESSSPIICSMRPGDFTKTGHFIVLTGVEDGKIKVNDPNSKIRSEQLWDYGTLEGQIKNLWKFSK